MTDFELQAILIKELTGRAYNLPLYANYQPTRQGRPEGGFIALHKINTRLHGTKGKKLSVDGTQYKTVQVVETVFQFTSHIDSNPTAQPRLSGSDVLRKLVSVIGESDFLQRMQMVHGVGVLRVADIVTLWTPSESDSNEEQSSFDIVLTSKELDVEMINTTGIYDAEIWRV